VVDGFERDRFVDRDAQIAVVGMAMGAATECVDIMVVDGDAGVGFEVGAGISVDHHHSSGGTMSPWSAVSRSCRARLNAGGDLLDPAVVFSRHRVRRPASTVLDAFDLGVGVEGVHHLTVDHARAEVAVAAELVGIVVDVGIEEGDRLSQEADELGFYFSECE